VYKRQGLPNRAGKAVELLGNLDFRQVQAINRMAAKTGKAAGISCSRTETQGVAILEQLAAGMPVAVPGGTVWKKDIDKSRAGILLSGDYEHDTMMLLNLVEEDGRRDRMSEFGPALIDECYNPVTQYRKLAGIYRQVAAS
jgi:glycosyltransferase involved in cell wall biosynthesis